MKQLEGGGGEGGREGVNENKIEEKRDETRRGSMGPLTSVSHVTCLSSSPFPQQQESTATEAHTPTHLTQLLQRVLLL